MVVRDYEKYMFPLLPKPIGPKGVKLIKAITYIIFFVSI